MSLNRIENSYGEEWSFRDGTMDTSSDNCHRVDSTCKLCDMEKKIGVTQIGVAIELTCIDNGLKMSLVTSYK